MSKLLLAVTSLALAILVTSCSLLSPGDEGVYQDASARADSRMGQIVAAVNNNETEALRGLFSERALAQAGGIDEGLTYFFSFFPKGGLTWERDSVGERVVTDSSGNETHLISAQYKVSANGVDYWILFEDFGVDEAKPDNVGLYALGAAPWSGDPQTGPERPLFVWAGSIHIDGNDPDGYPGMFLPPAQ